VPALRAVKFVVRHDTFALLDFGVNELHHIAPKYFAIKIIAAMVNIKIAKPNPYLSGGGVSWYLCEPGL
jgi:hypothetical protein